MAKVSIKIDKGIYEGLAKRAIEKGFSTTDNYIEDILKQIAKKLGVDASDMKTKEEKVKARLRALGYID